MDSYALIPMYLIQISRLVCLNRNSFVNELYLLILLKKGKGKGYEVTGGGYNVTI